MMLYNFTEFLIVPMGLDANATEVIAEDRGDHDREVFRFSPGIEEQTDQKDDQIFQFSRCQEI